jgi:8-oxo-dGTP diphosphatase
MPAVWQAAAMPTEPEIVVGAAIVQDGRLLTVQRAEPARLAGLWEFPGGKVERGETEVQALVRECQEELGLVLEIGDRVGPEVRTATRRYLLRIYLARVIGGTLHLSEHLDARWLAPEQLRDVPWIPADLPIVEAVADVLRG